MNGSPTGDRRTPVEWRLVDLGDPTACAAARRRSASILTTDPRRHLFHTVDWLLDATQGRPEDVRAFFLEAADGTVGYAPLRRQAWRLRFALGELTLGSRALDRLHLMGGALLGPASAARDETPLLRALFDAVHAALQARQVVFLEGVPVDAALGRLLDGEDRHELPFHVLRHGAPFARHLIRLPASFEDYLGALGRRTREGFRRSHRKLVRAVDGRLVLRKVTRPEQVAAFVADATALSRRTYQFHLLGLGLRDPAALAHSLSVLAARGWTRSYLLELAGAPAAFMIGYQYAGTYHYIDVGFDPAWQEHSVGTVMHLEVLRELIASEDRPRVFDFSTGTGVHKERFGTEARQEANYLLVPRGWRGAVLVGLYRAAERTSALAVGLADRLRLKAPLKRWLRRRAARAAPRS
ncbi:MAG: GNAT family N-acetyltransferase [Planctomycetes bacterium]|nr:GNAT family N-acetyltransferase [Planctomycetota bacterium]